MIIAKIPRILSRAFNSLTWKLPSENKEVYLTFDDGPTPEVTEWVLDQLQKHKARATFFCLGNNVEKHPALYKRILDEDHTVGNHSYSHIKGFRSSTDEYIEDVKKGSEFIDSKLFRPPYGRILPKQVRQLNKMYTIVMWSVLSVDYNQKLSGQQVVRNVVENVKPGSIIVFHDSIKASKNLYYALPEVLSYLTENGYSMQPISILKSSPQISLP